MNNRHTLHIGLTVCLPLVALILLITCFQVSASSTTVLVSAVYYDTYLPNEPDEAFRLINVSASTINLTNWTVSDGEGTITLTGSLDPFSSIWVANKAVSFTLEFGFSPNYEYGGNSDPSVPDLARQGTFSLANSGDELVIRNSSSTIIDSVVWEGGNSAGTGWSGATISPYDQGFFGIEGQILYRKLDQQTGQPVPDTDTANDWAQATDDNINGKKVMYPGWDLDRYFQTAQFTQTAVITYLIAPDNIFVNVRRAISSALTSIRYEGYTFDNAELGQALAARAAAGVSITVLLEGAPVGGVGDQDKWVCQQIENAGGQCWFMINDSTVSPPIHDRYAYQHAKFMIVDDKWLLTGSENLNYSSMPSDNKSDGTSGNRGIWLWTDASGPISHAQDVFQHDWDPTNHRDLRRWNAADPKYGVPPVTFTVAYTSGGTFYPVQFSQPFAISGNIHFELVQSPDNSLRDSDALLGMVARAGNGDRVLVEQLYEYKYWGPTSSTPITDPNPRLEAYIAAARRGTSVRLLLDSVYDDPGDLRGNTATCAYVNSLASTEGLDLNCLLGNPTGTGIHNKMVLVSAGGQGWVHTGSINGSENSAKQNREMAVQVQSTQAYNDLAQVFWYDWIVSGGVYTTPVLLDDFAPQPLQGDLVWYYNRLGGDRGQIDGWWDPTCPCGRSNGGNVTWGKGIVTATITQTQGTEAWEGLWTSFNHPATENIPLDFSAIFPQQVITQFQGHVTGIRLHILRGSGTLQAELQAPDLSTAWTHTATLSGGEQTVQFGLPTLGKMRNLNWLVKGHAGDYVVVDRVELLTQVPQLAAPERAFLWNYAMLLDNWDSQTGLIRDRANFPAGAFDNVSASGMHAVAAALAWHTGYITQTSAIEIISKTTTAVLSLTGCHGLLPHFVTAGQIASNTEWSSLDTVIAAIALIEARQMLGLETDQVEQLLTNVDWAALLLPNGQISHGYNYSCTQRLESGWYDFGTETWLANLGYAATTGNITAMDATPPTYNGSGFIDELAWLLVPAPSRDRWDIEWPVYREQAATTQTIYYSGHPCYGPRKLSGLSAAEVPDPASVPSSQIYQAFGVGGLISPNDGIALLGHAVMAPHYAPMIASLRPSQTITLWQWLEGSSLATPLNNVESLMFVDEPACNQVMWNSLKGSWNLALQTLGWGRLVEGDAYPLYGAMRSNSMLQRGYTILTTLPVDALQVTGPSTGAVGAAYTFTAATNLTASKPITYLWQATGQSPVLHVGSVTDTASFSWTATGTQMLTVTAINPAGAVTSSHAITIDKFLLYLPVVMRAYPLGIFNHGHARLEDGSGLPGVSIYESSSLIPPGPVPPPLLTRRDGYYAYDFTEFDGEAWFRVVSRLAGYTFEPPENYWRHLLIVDEPFKSSTLVALALSSNRSPPRQTARTEAASTLMAP